MNNMMEVTLLIYLLMNSFVFFLGANTAKNKRGRYLDKPPYEFAPDIIIKIAISMMGIIIYSYLVWKNKESLSRLLIFILALFYIVIIIVSSLTDIKILICKMKEKLKKGKSEDNNDQKVKKTRKSTISEGATRGTNKEIAAISNTALCNGCLAMLIVTSVVVMIIVLNEQAAGENSVLLLDYLKAVGLGNVFFILLFNSLLLQIFAISKFVKFDNTGTDDKENNELGKIIRFLKDDVES